MNPFLPLVLIWPTTIKTFFSCIHPSYLRSTSSMPNYNTNAPLEPVDLLPLVYMPNTSFCS